ncbi:MFS sugar transporter [Orbilia oligospora]|uniref:MFS sugar transporter n=1 Tax=Orbilia oligospora TaxID=2813651 RepID=A0A7C8KJ53_ORBOL|nr:MFS sugar transporter [Orbilia oligospora]TGJ71429.1 MFS sugar transporter [Orbilia oligospora]
MWRISNVYGICFIASIGGGLFGFDISSMSGVLGTQAYIRYFDNPLGYRQGGISAAMPAGSFAGSASSSFIADRFSRRTCLQIACIIWTIGAIIQAASINVGMLVAGRIIAGFSVGMASSMVPVYQSEIAPKEIRGRVVSLQQWAITWGILIQYFIQYGSSFVCGGAKNSNQCTSAFRIPWAVQIFPAVILFVLLFFCPYSPRWLASQDRWEEAKQVLADLHGNGDLNNAKVAAEYIEIEEAIRFEREQQTTPWQDLMAPKIRKRVILGIAIQAWSQLTGMNVLMYYIVYVFQGAGVTDPLLPASIQYVINVLLTLPAILFIDRVGRRPLLLAGSFFMMTFLFITGSVQAAYGQRNDDPESATTWVMVNHETQARVVIACSYLFVATFATTWGPCSWTYPAEIFPMRVRAKAVSLSTMSNWLWNCVLAFAVPPLLRSINWKMYFIFASFNGAALIHMFFTAEETKGRTLEEMDDVFSGSWWKAWKKKDASSRLDRQIAEIKGVAEHDEHIPSKATQ